MRHVLWLVLAYLAMIADLRLPAITTLPVPSCLDVLFLITLVTFRGANTVLWAGVLGLSGDVIFARQLGTGIAFQATLAFVVTQLWHQRVPQLPSRIVTIIVACGLLLCVREVISVRGDVNSIELSMMALQQIVLSCVAALAITVLLSTESQPDPFKQPAARFH